MKEVLAGRDDKIRGAVHRVANEGCRVKLLQQPLQLIYPLEICVPSSEIERSEPELENTEECVGVINDDLKTKRPRGELAPVKLQGSHRPRHAAALEA